MTGTINMITYNALAQLRFAEFLPEGMGIFAEDHYEWMNGSWHYEGIGFSWFGAPTDEPDRTSCLQLLADEIPSNMMARIMERIGLPIDFAMSRAQLEAVLGEPFATSTFSDDRITLDFITSGTQPYYVSCTVLHEGGLLFLSLLRGDLYTKYTA